MRKCIVFLAIPLALFLSGCSAEWPFRWKAGESIRQAQALVEDNIEAAKPHTNEAGKVHLEEADGAARVVTTYVSPPEVRLKPVQPINQGKIEQAMRDARKPEPTTLEVVRELPAEAERTVLPWVDLGITLLLAFGATGAGAAALRYRKKGRDVLEAFRETVQGIENGKAVLSDAQAEKLLDELAKAQSTPAKALVEKVKAGKAA